MVSVKFLRLFILLSIPSAFAENLERDWAPVPHADFYEYQIATTADFSKNNIKESAKAKEPKLKIDLSPGNYHLRIRAIDGENGPGEWSATEEIRISDKRIRILKPMAGDQVKISSPKSRIIFSWDEFTGVDDYELHISKSDSTHKRIFITRATSFEVDGFGVGQWRAVLTSRKNGELVAESPPVNFGVLMQPFEGPQIVEPEEEGLITAYDRSLVRWIRRMPGLQSEITIRRADASNLILNRVLVPEGSESVIPELPPGIYQITVRNFTDDSAESAEKSVTVIVQSFREKEIERAKNFGLQLKIFENLGWGHRYYSNRTTINDRVFSNKDSTQLSFDLVAEARLNSHWGIDLGFGFSSPRLTTPNPWGGSDVFEVGDSGTDQFFTAGAHRTMTPWGVLNPLALTGALRWHRRATVFETNNESFTPTFQSALMEEFKTLGLVLGARSEIAGWSDYWDLATGLECEFSFLSYGNRFGTGHPKYFLPDLKLRVQLRRRLSSDLSFSFGPFIYLQHLSVSEDGSSKPTLERTRLMGISLSLQSKI